MERLCTEVESVKAGIGVSWGEVVADNIGGAKRFEYTVIGDAVNEAARLMDLARERKVGVLASSAAVEEAADGEACNWELATRSSCADVPSPPEWQRPMARWPRRTAARPAAR